MAKRKIYVTDHQGRRVRVLTSGPVQPSKGPAEKLIDAARENKSAAGKALIVAGAASAITLLPPNRPTETISNGPGPVVVTELPAFPAAPPQIAPLEGVAQTVVSDELRVLRAPAAPLLQTMSRDLPIIPMAPPPPLMQADAETGPFRAGMRTGFDNNQVLTAPMAEAMNIAFERFQHHGFSERASLTFAMQGINESLAGTVLVEGGGGDGVGYFQFSRWDGNGVGAEVAALTKPGTDRAWQPSDFSAEDGDRATAIRNAVDATVQLLAEDPDYAGLNTMARDADASFEDLARATTTGFMRPSTATSTRVTQLETTLTRNSVAIRANIDALQAHAQDATVTRLAPGSNP